ncbi:unnamed protein product, partial [Gongylonema pulchrum]
MTVPKKSKTNVRGKRKYAEKKTQAAQIRRRRSRRLRVPSKRLNSPDAVHAGIAEKKVVRTNSGKAEQEHAAEIQEAENFKGARSTAEVCTKENQPKKPSAVSHRLFAFRQKSSAVPQKFDAVLQETQKLSVLSSANSNHQMREVSETAPVSYSHKAAESVPLGVNPSSLSVSKYTSRKDVDDLLEEVDSALACIPNRQDFINLRQNIEHHLTNLQRENSRNRKMIRQLKAELDNLASDEVVARCAKLMKQNSELREQKVYTDIRYEAREAEIRKLKEEIKFLQKQNGYLDEEQRND